jgi:hypothetical protein
MTYRAEQDPECGCWLVLHDETELAALVFRDDEMAARDMATLLSWAEEDRLRHVSLRRGNLPKSEQAKPNCS